MQERFFLRRKVFISVNIVNIALFLVIIATGLWKGKDKAVLRLLLFFYAVLFSFINYLFTIISLGISTLLYSIYLNIFNFFLVCVLIILRFLFRFEAKHPYGIFFESIPVISGACVSLGTALFIMIVRRYMVQALTSPVSVQRAKGIELSIVLIRREYPEVFQ
ncbi:hypothetical protein NEFER03_1966 [Nematocida sp. LUAm3]|nr:hypothetical protein NEFER03_1966 [Nematocida sp. LUAm3]KAI5176050.1 hypothetical protein NEFER02_1884 [Nematocida sp. LUAm2]KAI5177094.1 hypothetical protein NEFER01_0369 [Nematocida sp. LUAm1]